MEEVEAGWWWEVLGGWKRLGEGKMMRFETRWVDKDAGS